jgi:Na+/H+ antiporter NhaD/arsenite permease-like protein
MIIASFIIVNAGLLASGGMDVIASGILSRIRDLRTLTLVSLVFTVIASMFITNDASLIALVPLTVSIGKLSGRSVTKLVILQAIAANVGSMLTPFGNPQNIIIFRAYGLSVLTFLYGMLPIFMVSFAILLAFGYLLSGRTRLSPAKIRRKRSFSLFLSSTALFAIDVAGMLMGYGIYFFAATAVLGVLSMILFGLRGKSRLDGLKNIDLFLIFTFVLIFLVVNSARSMIGNVIVGGSIEVFGYSLVLSQFISNVPTAVLFGAGGNWLPLAWGVDVGGNGTIIASLANIIALRRLKGRKIVEFSKISFAFLGITAVIAVAFLLFLGY